MYFINSEQQLACVDVPSYEESVVAKQTDIEDFVLYSDTMVASLTCKGFVRVFKTVRHCELQPAVKVLHWNNLARFSEKFLVSGWNKDKEANLLVLLSSTLEAIKQLEVGCHHASRRPSTDTCYSQLVPISCKGLTYVVCSHTHEFVDLICYIYGSIEFVLAKKLTANCMSSRP